MNATTKSGAVLSGRAAEIYLGQCPPERPCSEEQIARYRQLYDQGQPATRQAAPGPGVVQRVGQWGQAMAEEMRWRAGGGRGPTAEEKAARRALCSACEKRDADKDTCTACGCYLEAGLLPPRPLGKLDCACETCPLEKWGRVAGCQPTAGCGGCGPKVKKT